MKKTKNQNKFAKGAIILSASAILCKFIGAFYRVPLSNILGPEGIGVYQLIFPVYSLFLVFASGGVSVALSKLVAQCRAKEQHSRAKRFLFQAIIILFCVSLVFSLVFVFGGKTIASFQGNEKAALGYFGVALTLVFASVLTAFRGYFQGYQNMVPTAISQAIEQIFKLFLGLTFAFLLVGKGIEFGALGAIIGICISEFIALCFLALLYLFKKGETKHTSKKPIENSFFEDFKTLVKLSLPITLNASILPLILAVDSFLVVNLLLSSGASIASATQMFGVYSGMISSLVNFPTVVSAALAVSLIPAISYEKEQGKNQSASSIFKIVFYVSVPSILFFFVFSKQIILILYPSAINTGLVEIASNLLRVCSINILYISLLQITTSILQARGKSLTSLFNLTLAGVVKVLLTYFFVISPLGIYGAAVASIMCYAIACGLNIICLRDQIQISFSVKNLIYIFINSVVVLLIAFGINELLLKFCSTLISLIFSVLIAVVFYFILSFIFPIFDEKEIEKIPYGRKINLIKNKFKRKKQIK